MSREMVSSSSYSLSTSSTSTTMKATQSRIPVKAKRAPLGERTDNHDHSTPRQHLVKPIKSVIRPRILSTKSTASPSKSAYRPSPRANIQGSPSSSTVSSPAGANVSRPGHTPHPRRSSVGLAFLGNDVSMLMDTTRPDFVSDTDGSEDDEPTSNMLVRRGVMGPGRLMTPANSQESQPNSQEHTLKEPSPRRLAMRLPTPPASQPGTDIEETIQRTLVRPRPAPTPPRRSAAPSILLNGSASPTQEISPNPRRKKSPRVDEAGPSQIRSPFEIIPTTNTASPRHPRDRVEIVIGQPLRKSMSPSATPKATKPRKARLSTKTPASHPLSQSTSSTTSRARKAPATAPQPNRRKSTPAPRKASPPRTSAKPKFAKTPKRLSVPGRGRGRKSVTPAELEAMAGLLSEPVEQGSPSDDPLLLKDDDEEFTRKTPAVRPSSHSGKNTGSKSAARIIDFDAAIQGRSNDVREITRDFEVPIHGSEPEYDGQDLGFDSGDSDDEGMGNDTFVNVAGARTKLAMADQQQEDPSEEDGSPVSSRSHSPFEFQATEAVRHSSPARSNREASPVKEASAQLLSSPVIQSNSPAQSMTSLPSPFIRSHSFDSPRLSRSGTVTPIVHSHDLPSPAASSPLQDVGPKLAASSPRYGRTQTETPRATSTLDEAPMSGSQHQGAPVSPARSAKFSTGMLSAPSSPLSIRDRSTTPRVQIGIQAFEHGSTYSPAHEGDEEQVQDSWNASPLLLPGTPSALGLFLPEEADGMSTPYSHVGVEPDTPATATASPTRSVASRVDSPTLSMIAHAASPARSVATSIVSPARSSVSHFASPSPYIASQVASPTRSITSQVASPTRSIASQTEKPPAALTQSPRRSTVCLTQEPQEMDLPEELPVVYTHSPRRSPVCLPVEMASREVEEQSLPVVYTHSPKRTPAVYEQSPRQSPVSLPGQIEDEKEVEDKENTAPIQSTTPILSPPALKSTPPMYAFTFSPRIASPLRLTQTHKASPARESLARNSQSPIPAVESLNERFGEVEECASADVTLEGNSADWSLSDEGVPEVDDEATGLGLDLQAENQDVEEEHELFESVSTVEEEEEEEQADEEDALVDSSIEEKRDLDFGAESTSKIHEAGVQPDFEDDQEYEEEQEVQRAEESAEHEVEEEPAESAEDEDEEEGSNLVAPEPTFTQEELQGSIGKGESTDSEEAPSDEEDEGHETTQQDEEESPASPVPVKIVLKLVNRGIVKIEPPISPVGVAVGLPTPLDASEARSTTPAYDPPQSVVTGVLANRSTAPAVSTLYPALPTTPVTAALSPLVSTTPLGSPPVRHQSPLRQQNAAQLVEYTSLQPEPSTRPRSRLSRQIPDSPEQEGSDSIRVRTPRSLGLELENAEADSSMRSVVEVSSLDPKAAARAAAILKLNHAYIEHGDISKLGESTKDRRPSMHSARLNKLDASRREDKTELLYEAELEIVSTRRSRSRSMSRFRGVSEAATELALPGAWNGTPKRKRSAHLQIEAPKTTCTWGVSQWKKLDKVFRAEREIWVTERNVKAMPGGFIGWARMSTFGPPAAVSKPWDPSRVVDRFLDEQAISEAEQLGDWSREMIYTRVEALERHSEHRRIKATVEERSPKKSKIESPAPAPPSTVRKLFGWVMPSATKSSTPVAVPFKNVTEDEQDQRKDKGKGRERGQTLKDRLEAIQAQPEPRPMTQLSDSVSISRPMTFSGSTPVFTAPLHPSSPAWKSAGPSRLSTTSIPISYINNEVHASTSTTRPTPRTLSEILAESSSSRGQLHSSLSLSQRSAALDALFSGSTSTKSTVTVPVIKRSSSVRDIVKGFEDSGALDRSVSRESLSK